MIACPEMVTTVPLRPVAVADDWVPPATPQFEIGRQLGSGGMGVVFEARDVLLQRRVALKFSRPKIAPIEMGAARLLREARALARLSHPNIVSLFEIGAAGDHIFIAMELVDGGTLREWLREPRDWRAVVDMFITFGRGLAAAHELGLVHRDINPSNIFLDRAGTPKLGDFGLVSSEGALQAEPLTSTSTTTTGRVLGTPAYMAPEQARASRVDARADQFAFCVSLHEALTGAFPHEARGARPLPPRLRPILARGLALDPDARFPTTTALLDALADARRGWLARWLNGRSRSP